MSRHRPTPHTAAPRRTVHAALLVLLGAFALVALLAPASALAQGPDPQLVVSSVPDPTQPSGTGNVVQTFDSASDTEIGSVPVGTNPIALAINPTGSTAYVANQSSGTVTPVSISSLSTAASLCLPAGNCAGGGDPNTLPEGVALTPNGSNAYVVNSGENSVSVIGISNGTARVQAPQITSSEFSNPDAIAITPNGNTAWVANYSSGTVVPVSIPSGKVGSAVNVGAEPTSLAITPNGSDLIVTNSGSGTVSDVNLASQAVNTFALEPANTGVVTPQAVAISPDGTTAFVADSANNELVPVTIAGDTPGDPVPVNGDDPVAVAVAPNGTQAFVADEQSDEVSVMTLTNDVPSFDTTIATDGSPTALALTPDQAPTAAFTITPGTAGSQTEFDGSNSTTTPAGGALSYTWDFGDGSMQTTSSPTTTHTYANPGTYNVTLTVTDAAGTSTSVVFTGQTVSLNGGPTATSTQSFTVQSALSGAPPEGIVAIQGNNTATPIAPQPGSPPSATPGIPTTVGSSPTAVAIDPSGNTAYVVDTNGNQVTPIDLSTGQAESTARWIPVGSEPDAIAITPNGRYAYVVNGGSTTVTQINLQTHATSTITIPAAAGADLDAIAITPDGSRAYVLDAANNTITQITLGTGAVGNPVGGSGLVSPVAIGIAPNGNTAYVVDAGSSIQAGGITTVNITGANPAPIATTSLFSAADHPDAIAIDPSGASAYIVDAPTNGDPAGVVSVALSPSVYRRTSITLKTATELYGIAETPDGTALYVTGTTSGSQANVVFPVGLSSTGVLTAGAPVGLGGQPSGIAFAPDQAPNAELSVTSPDAAGAPVSFDASASSNPSSAITSYTFNFGDGSAPVTTSSPRITHTYAVGGSFTATVTETDAAGTSTTQVFTGQTVSRNGNSNAVASQQVGVTPSVTTVAPNTGPSGTSVTITGAGFSTASGATSVHFGTVAATTVSCTSTTRCTATAPAGTGSVDVTVTVGGQTSATSSADQFTYTSAAAPTVTSLTPSTGPSGTLVTISGTGFSTASGTTTVHFGTAAGTGVMCSTTTQCTATAPAGTGTVNVTVTVAGKTSATSSADQFIYQSTPPSAPTVTGISPTTGGAGTSVIVSGTGFSSTSGATSISFGTAPATAVSCSSATRCTATAPAGTGTVDVTVTVGGQTSATSSADQFTYQSTPPSTPTVTSLLPNSGSAGTSVGISGTGFSTTPGATSVSFGGVAATGVSCSSTTHCMATAPAGTGTVDVTVTVGGQTSPTSAGDQFTYSGGAGVTVTGVSPSSGPSGTVVTITGTGFSTTAGATHVSFSGTLAATVSCASTTQCTVTAPSRNNGITYITVTVGTHSSTTTGASAFTYANPVMTHVKRADSQATERRGRRSNALADGARRHHRRRHHARDRRAARRNANRRHDGRTK